MENQDPKIETQLDLTTLTLDQVNEQVTQIAGKRIASIVTAYCAVVRCHAECKDTR